MLRSMLLCGLAASLLPGAITFETNLLTNAGAEASLAPNGWTVGGAARVVAYGTSDYPGLSSPGPSDRGSNFFAGGNAVFSSLTQSIDVSSLLAQIDARWVGVDLSGYLGGYSGQNDNARLTARFLDAADDELGSLTIGPVTPAERGDVTGLLFRSASSAVPTNTRTIVAVIEFQRASGSDNDGYADNLWLSLTSTAVPEPATLLLTATALAAICLRRQQA